MDSRRDNCFRDVKMEAFCQLVAVLRESNESASIIGMRFINRRRGPGLHSNINIYDNAIGRFNESSQSNTKSEDYFQTSTSIQNIIIPLTNYNYQVTFMTIAQNFSIKKIHPDR